MTVPSSNATVIPRLPLGSAEKGNNMYEITVKWPDGRVITNGDYTKEQASALVDFLWAAGAGDVRRVCVCNNCETCYDRATFTNSEI